MKINYTNILIFEAFNLADINQYHLG